MPYIFYLLERGEMQEEIIEVFRGRYRFLSNFYPSVIKYNDLLYPTVEHAYQSQKVIENSIKEEIRKAKTPKEAKQLKKKGTKIKGWDKIKYDLMKELVMIKFSTHNDLKAELIATSNKKLIEGNIWHDNTWGNCLCNRCKDIEGKNMLGQILMDVREKLKG